MRHALFILVLFHCTAGALAQHDEIEAFIRDGLVQVDVVGPNERPLSGVPVTCVFRVGERLVPAVFGTPPVISPIAVPPLDVVATTDSHGRATLEIGRAGIILLFFAGAARPEDIKGCVSIAAPLANAPVVEFRLDRLPKDPMRLVCPATTSMSVRILDAKGQPETRPAILSAQVTDGAAASRPLLRGIAFAATHGEGALPLVEPGRRIKLAARVEGEKKPRAVEVVVNRADGVKTTVELPPADCREVELALRAIAPSGKPVADMALEVEVSTGPALLVPELLPGRDETLVAPIRRVGRTDSDGRLTLSLGEVADHDPWVATKIRLRPATPFLGVPTPCIAEIDLPRGLRCGIDDIGDVKSMVPKPIAEGRIVDEALRPLAGVSVRVEALRTNLWGVDLDQLSERGERLAFRPWVPIPGALAVSDRHGRFRVMGASSRHQLRLVAAKPGYAQSTDGLLDGARSGVVLAMVPACQLAGTVLVDPGISTQSISIDVHGAPEAAVQRDRTAPDWSGEALFERFASRTAMNVKRDGSFTFPVLAPGTAEVRVLVAAVEAFALRAVSFRAGQVTRPPELNPIDLRGKLYKRVFHVTDPDGAAVADATVSLSIEDQQSGPHRAKTDTDGNASFFLPATQSENSRHRRDGGTPKVHAFVLRSETFRDASVRNVTADTTIVLERKHFLRVRVKDGIPLPRPPFMLSCVIDPEGFKSERHNYPFGESERGAQLGPAGEGQVDLKSPGRYTVRLFVWVLMPDCGWDIPVEFAGPTTVDLAADGRDEVEIDVTESAIDAAIKKAVESTFPKRTPR